MRGRVLIVVVLAASCDGIAAQDATEIDRLLATLGAEKLDAVAMDRLSDIGAPAVPALASLLGSAPEIWMRQRVLRVLRSMHGAAAAAIPALEAQFELDVSDPTERAYRDAVLQTLALIVPFTDAPSKVARLRSGEVLEHKAMADQFRHEAWRGILRLQVRNRGAVRPGAPLVEIAKGLASANPVEREFAAELLGLQGAHALPYLDVLRQAAIDRHPSSAMFEGQRCIEEYTSAVNRAARIAIARIAPDDADAIRGLRDLLRAADRPFERLTAVMALGRHGERARLAVNDLAPLLHDADRRVVLETITTLGMIEKSYGALEEWLTELAEGRDRAIAVRARVTLERFRHR